jgi:hypothetical protein
LRGKVGHQRLRTRVGQHPPHLLFERCGISQRAVGRHIDQLVVRDAAPEEERQTGGQLEIADVVRAVRLKVLWIPLDAEQELRAHEQASERHLDPRREVPRGPAFVVEAEQQLEVRVGDRPPICPTSQGRENLIRTCNFRRL